uniref:Uncharacterized protein n=1 Tax=Geobacter metallireducens TaxID=28232 RepID=A0A831XDX5_GEOME
MNKTILLAIALLCFALSGAAEAKWWIFGQANDEVNISYLHLNGIPYEESGPRLTVYRDMLANGEMVLRGKARAGKGKIGGVSVSLDNRETWKEASYSSDGGFEFRFRPEIGKTYIMLVEVTDTAGKTNDLESTRKEITVSDGSFQNEVRNALDALIAAYRAEDPAAFMSRVSEEFAADPAVLDKAIRKDFTNFDKIDLRYTLNNVVSGNGGIFVSITYSRQLTSARNGKTVSDRGVTELVFRPTDRGLKVFSMKFPLIFGLSDSSEVATGTVNSGTNEPVIVVSSDGTLSTVPFSEALTGTDDVSGVESGSGLIVSQFHPPMGFDFVSGEPSNSSGASFFITGGVTGSAYGFLAIGHAFRDLGSVSLNSVTEAPADGYQTDSGIGYYFLDGHTYAFRLPNGTYALMYVSQVMQTPSTISMQISYKYQPNGSRTF